MERERLAMATEGVMLWHPDWELSGKAQRVLNFLAPNKKTQAAVIARWAEWELYLLPDVGRKTVKELSAWLTQWNLKFSDKPRLLGGVVFEDHRKARYKAKPLVRRKLVQSQGMRCPSCKQKLRIDITVEEPCSWKGRDDVD